MIAVHVRRSSPKRPNAKLSIYVQRHRQGVSWKIRNTYGALLRFKHIRVNEPDPNVPVWDYEVCWTSYYANYKRRTRRYKKR